VCQHEKIKSQRISRMQSLNQLEAIADKTFENFILEPPGLTPQQTHEIAIFFGHAHDFAQNPRGWLLFEGSYGCGKTHLAAAIANYRLANNEPVLFITMPDLLDHLRAAYAPSSDIEYDELFEHVRNCPVLILDDLGAESSTAWAQEKLYQLINHRYTHKFPTVITTNAKVDELDPRIASRISDWHLTRPLRMDLPDFRQIDMGHERKESISNLDLYREMRFENFDSRENTLPQEEQKNLRSAVEVATNYAKNPRGWLLLLGGHGSGKTHLAASIANSRRDNGDPVVMITTPDLLDYLRAALNSSANTSFDKRFQEIRTAPLLIIDQLDLSSATAWAREKIHQVLEYRYLKQLPTVFTSSQKLEDIDSQIQSRLLDRRVSYVFAIHAPDYRGGYDPKDTKNGERKPRPR
jgi:DNA replication protein DnaC